MKHLCKKENGNLFFFYLTGKVLILTDYSRQRAVNYFQANSVRSICLLIPRVQILWKGFVN